MSNYTAEFILKSGQILPLKKLFSFFRKNDFEIRPTSNGHFLVRHEVYRDLFNNLNDNCKDLGYQRDCARLLIEAKKRDLANKKNLFQESAFANVHKLYQDLPSHLTAEHNFEQGHTVVRDDQLPQLGVTILFSEFHLLENKIHNIIEPLKRQVYEQLGRARADYDMNTPFENGVFTGRLSHKIYDIPSRQIPQYQAGANPFTLLEDIGDYMLAVTEKDITHQSRLDSALKKDFIGASMIVYNARRGERTHIVPLQKPDGTSFTLKFETASRRRADIDIGRITEDELARVEKTIGGLVMAHIRTSVPTARFA